MAYGTNNAQNAVGEVSVGSAGAERLITNVAAGSAVTDAVNLGQLQTIGDRATNAATGTVHALGGGAAYDPTTGIISGPAYAIAGASYDNAGSALAALDTSVTTLTNNLATTNGDLNVIAARVANVEGSIVTSATNLANLADGIDQGRVGLLQQSGGAPGNGDLTVGAQTGGTTVDFTGAAGTRNLTGVAAGMIDESSTDAINGSQLFATNQQVATNVTRIADNAAAIGLLNAQVSGNIASISDLADAIDKGAVGIVQQIGGTPGVGGLTVGAATGGTSIDMTGTEGARIVMGVGTGINATDAVNVAQLAAAITSISTGATGVQYDYPGQTSLTFNADGEATTLSNVAQGNLDEDSREAVNGGQLYATNQRVAENATAISALNSGAAGAFRASSSGHVVPENSGADSVAGGFGAVASGAQSTAIGNGASASGNNSVALGFGSSDGGVANVVSVGAAGAERQIVNVAAGTRTTDAVNLGQLSSSLSGTLQSANSYTDQRLAGMSFDLQNARRDAQSGTASAMAVAGLPQAFEAGKSMIAGGFGVYEGETAFAFGASRILNDGQTIIKGGATYASRRGSVGANVGVGLQF